VLRFSDQFNDFRACTNILLDDFLDFYMDVLNAYQYVFRSMVFEISVQICGLHAYWVLNFLSIAVLFCACMYLNGLIIFLRQAWKDGWLSYEQ
jgi:hypothetical protein